MNAAPDPAFWRSKRVLVTGHTGFKGAWAVLWLQRAGAVVTGLALPPDTEPALFELLRPPADLTQYICDLGDRSAVSNAVSQARPEIVLHLAAQSIVRRAARDPVSTAATNVLGTAHLLEALRGSPDLEAVLVVTTDKVYDNTNAGRRFVESDPLGGHEPYGASKAAAEMLTRAFAESYFAPRGIPVATARGGNVIGGGDFGEDRLIPDLVRSVVGGEPALLRNPESTRPWQHVFDCLAGYFAYLESLASGRDVPRALNFGPSGAELTVGSVAEAVLSALGARTSWQRDAVIGPREAERLAIDSAAARQALGWSERLASADAIDWTAAWYTAWRDGQDMRAFSLAQIDAYEALAEPAAARTGSTR